MSPRRPTSLSIYACFVSITLLLSVVVPIPLLRPCMAEREAGRAPVGVEARPQLDLVGVRPRVAEVRPAQEEGPLAASLDRYGTPPVVGQPEAERSCVCAW